MTIETGDQVESTRRWPGMRSEYAWLPPHEGFSVTNAYQIGASFTHHRDLVFRHDGRESVRSVEAGAVFVTGAEGIVWSPVMEHGSVGNLSGHATAASAAACEGCSALSIEPAAFVREPVVLSIAATLKRVHITSTYLNNLAASKLAQRLVDQILQMYSGVRHLRAQRSAGRLSQRTLKRVSDYIESHLATTITLQQLAGLANLSPFHFARQFKQSIGMALHQIVTMVESSMPSGSY